MGIVMPTAEWENEEKKRTKGYSFEALVFLRLLRMLRESDIPLRRAVETVQDLTARFGPPGPKWEDARIFTWENRVWVYGRDKWQTLQRRQRAADMLFGSEFERLRDRTDALLIPQQFQGSVEIDPSIRNGLPIVTGTTFPTSIIHAMRQQKMSHSDIQREYPFIPLRKVKGAALYEEFLDEASSLSEGASRLANTG
jgi:uncharacterized protein (DUF433 family)